MMNSNVSLKILKKNKDAVIPIRATNGAAGLDLFACLSENVVLKAGESAIIPTGIAIELPNENLAAFIFARSGIASKFGIALSNGVGVVDSDYRGEVCVALRNFSDQTYIIKNHERIAQLVIMPVCCLPIIEVDSLNETVRGIGGFGSTGTTFL